MNRNDRRAMQVALAGFLFWMAYRLSWPDNLLDQPMMEPMRFQSETAWMWQCCFGGAIGVYSTVARNRRVELVATAMVLSAHLTLSGFLIEGKAALLPGALLAFVGLCLWTVYRTWREAK